MKFIQKILFVAIVGLFGVDAEGTQPPQPQAQTQTVFDLPVNTPGLQKNADGSLKTQQKTVCGQQKACVHVIVNGNNIYFPADGTQPTSKESGKYSCANIDNREDSPITEWYMKMFGVIPYKGDGSNENDYIKAGWGADATIAQRIISFDATCNGGAHDNCTAVDTNHMVSDPNIPPTQISRRALFEREFRKIASNPVGRVLLYRILIEIRRNIDGKPDATRYTYDGAQEERNQCCSIIVYYGENAFYYQRGVISFKLDSIPDTVIGDKISTNTRLKYSETRKIEITQYHGSYAIVIERSKPLDVTLFHELNHWLHFLKNQKRYKLEINNKSLLNSSIGQYYWEDFISHKPKDEEYISGIQWQGTIGKKNACPEEIRNILGMPVQSLCFENGDDLSENLYRKGKNLPLRFGHRNMGFIESKEAVEKVLNNIENSNTITDGDIGGNLSDFRKGLGNSLGHD